MFNGVSPLYVLVLNDTACHCLYQLFPDVFLITLIQLDVYISNPERSTFDPPQTNLHPILGFCLS